MSTSTYLKGSPTASKVILPLPSSQWPRQFFSSRFATASLASSTSSASASEVVANLPVISPPAVSNWLLLSSALVFGIIVVGGVTRLTESGLSITEWKPITGILPPLSQEAWQEEFDKYKLTPEFKLLNHQITLSEFKRIFFWEYTHRVLGRVIGLGFVVPYAYFMMKKRLTPSLPAALGGLALLIGFQGALGWYMVQSGLEDSLMHTPGAVPRVSQYRLAAHLGTAFVLFAGMLGIGLGIRRDWKWAHGGTWSGLASFEQALASPAVRRFKGAAWGLLGLVFLTALSGAFVAGLDAGLLYNEFPLMGGRLAPPSDELFSPAYCQRTDHSDKWWRNLLENPTTVQFDHRVLAMTTYASTLALWVASLRTPNLPPLTRHLTRTAFTVANVQVLLGISTLLYLVPIPLAAAHQAGSVALLTAMVGLVGSLRRPGQAARLWREARALGKVVKSQ